MQRKGHFPFILMIFAWTSVCFSLKECIIVHIQPDPALLQFQLFPSCKSSALQEAKGALLVMGKHFRLLWHILNVPLNNSTKINGLEFPVSMSPKWQEQHMPLIPLRTNWAETCRSRNTSLGYALPSYSIFLWPGALAVHFHDDNNHHLDDRRLFICHLIGFRQLHCHLCSLERTLHLLHWDCTNQVLPTISQQAPNIFPLPNHS